MLALGLISTALNLALPMLCIYSPQATAARRSAPAQIDLGERLPYVS
jgi:hypothetical protein